MLLLQYFGWVGGFLFAALLAANWCFSAPIALAPRSDVPFTRGIRHDALDLGTKRRRAD
jgi:hypothetical protein